MQLLRKFLWVTLSFMLIITTVGRIPLPAEATSGSLKVYVKNVDGTFKANVKVTLYDSTWQYLSAQYTNSEGYVFWSSLPDGQYYIEVYYSSPAALHYTEFWGANGIYVSGETVFYFSRHTQWVYDILVNGKKPYAEDILVYANDLVKIDVTIKNLETESKNTQVTVLVDRDKNSPWDFAGTSQSSISSGGFGYFSWNYYPSTSGTYYIYVMAEGYYNGRYIVTDQWDWTKAFIVIARTPPSLTLFDPQIDDKRVTIDGVATPGTPGTSITRIHWNWGDGYEEDRWFPATHTYSNYGNYIVTVTAYQSDGLYTTKSTLVSLQLPTAYYKVTIDPDGGRIYVDGTPITTATTYTWVKDSTHTLDPDSGYQPNMGTRLLFSNWNDGSTADPRTITVTSDATYKANWKTQYKLTIGVEPTGSGTTTPSSGEYWHDKGSSVTVTATPASGYTFDHWELDGQNAGTGQSYTVVMNNAHNLKAMFKANIQISTPSVVDHLKPIETFVDLIQSYFPDGKYADFSVTVQVSPSELVQKVEMKMKGVWPQDTFTLVKIDTNTYGGRVTISDPNDWIDLFLTFFVDIGDVIFPGIEWADPYIIAIRVTDIHGVIHERSFNIRAPTAKDWMFDLYTMRGYRSTYLTIFCPADILVYDHQGRRVGAIYENGIFKGIVQEIPGAYYFGHIGDHTEKIIHLPYSIEAYRVVIIGYGEGSYNLTIFTIMDENFSGSVITKAGEISEGQVLQEFLIVGENGTLKTVSTMINAFEVYIGGQVFRVDIESNSTLYNFIFNQSHKAISFNVTGEEGTSGFCNVTIPKALLRGEPWTVLIDGAPVSATITENATHTSLYFIYTHSTHTIQIIGTWVIAPSPLTYILTITTAVGGTTNPTPGTYTYTANLTAQVTAIPDANYIFDHWELDSVNVGSANPYTVLMDNNHTLKAVFTYSPPSPPLTASISPLSASILVGQSVTFTSTVMGGYTPYSYQWYLNGNPVSGATSPSWIFTPTTSGIYYVYLKVIDSKGNTAQSDTARITVATIPVGGYSIPIHKNMNRNSTSLYFTLAAVLTVSFIAIKRKTTKKNKT